MARDADHNDLNDLFQLLTHARDLPPAIARAQILQQLQFGRLEVELHIRGGTRMIHPFRQATNEAPKDGVIVDGYHLYKTAPSEGIIEPLPADVWGRLFHLVIEGEQLVVEPNCAVDYPWDACTCVISNWSVVAELWPPRVERSVSPPAMAKSKKWRWTRQRQILDALVRRHFEEQVPESTAAVRNQIENDWPAECQTQKIKAPFPSWDMVDDYLAWRRNS